MITLYDDLVGFCNPIFVIFPFSGSKQAIKVKCSDYIETYQLCVISGSIVYRVF